MSSRGLKKNWRYKIVMSDKEMKYWLSFLKKNEKRLIKESCCFKDNCSICVKFEYNDEQLSTTHEQLISTPIHSE